MLTGSIVLVADLIRRLDLPLRVGLVQARSYRGAATRPGQLEINDSMLPDIRDRDVLLVDDIFDTGHTLAALHQQMQSLGPRSLRSAVLLRKLGRQEVDFEPDHVVFQIPDVFVVGYGLDYRDAYRQSALRGGTRRLRSRRGARPDDAADRPHRRAPGAHRPHLSNLPGWPRGSTAASSRCTSASLAPRRAALEQLHRGVGRLTIIEGRSAADPAAWWPLREYLRDLRPAWCTLGHAAESLGRWAALAAGVPQDRGSATPSSNH